MTCPVEITVTQIQADIAYTGVGALVTYDPLPVVVTFDELVCPVVPAAPAPPPTGGSCCPIKITAGEDIPAGAVLAVDSTGAIKARGTNASNRWRPVAVALRAATAGRRVRAVTGGLVGVLFTVAPAAASNGAGVFLSSSSPGYGTLTPPTGSGVTVVRIGTLVGADGSDLTPGIVFEPSIVARRP